MKLHPKTGLPVPKETPLSILFFIAITPLAIWAGILHYQHKRKKQ